MRKIRHDEFIRAVNLITSYKQQIKDELDGVEKVISDARIPEVKRKDVRIIDCDISVRLLGHLGCYAENFGKSRWDMLLSDLENVSVKELKKYRGFGKKSLYELNRLCAYANIKLKP